MSRAEYQRAWRAKNPTKARAYVRAYKRRNQKKIAAMNEHSYWRLVGTREGMARRMVYKAKERGREDVKITAADVLAVWPKDEQCPVFKTPFFYGRRPKREPQPTAPSLDRIDHKKGYVAGNIAVISWRANKIKTDAIAAELEAVAAWLRRME